MKVLVVSPLPPLADGIADYAEGLWRAYAAAGHEVRAVATAPGSDRSGVLGWLSLNPVRLLATLARVHRFGPDVVHVQHTVATYAVGLGPLWLLALVARAGGAEVVVTHHEVTRDVERLGLPGRLYYRVVTALCHRAHVHTEGASTELVSRLGADADDVLVHPHPIFDLPVDRAQGARVAREHGVRDDQVVLLQFGFVQTEKGLLEAVEALGVLLARRPDLADRLRLVVAGDVRPRPSGFARFEEADRAYFARARDAVTRLGMQQQVVLTGRVPTEQVPAWFARADVVLLPYLRTEQSGVANLAISAGAPVLATHVSGLGELLGSLPRISDLAADPFSKDIEVAVDAASDDAAALRSQVAAAYAPLRERAAPAELVARIVRGRAA